MSLENDRMLTSDELAMRVTARYTTDFFRELDGSPVTPNDARRLVLDVAKYTAALCADLLSDDERITKLP
jgi:hypothetical protein